MKGLTILMCWASVWLSGSAGLGETSSGGAAMPAEASLLGRLVVATARPGKDGEETVKSTSRVTLLMDFLSDRSLGEGVRQFTGVIRAATLESVSEAGTPTEVRDAPNWEVFHEAVGEGKARSGFRIDTRGRWQMVLDDKDDVVESSVSTYLETFLPYIFPPLPQEGVPFEAGEEWQYEKARHWDGQQLRVRCESVKVWLSGDTEIVLEGSPKYGHEIVVSSEYHWVLKGNPPAVKEATRTLQEAHQKSGLEAHSEVSVRVLSGGIPVRPVEALPQEKDQRPAAE
jgi:hypothetical protein